MKKSSPSSSPSSERPETTGGSERHFRNLFGKGQGAKDVVSPSKRAAGATADSTSPSPVTASQTEMHPEARAISNEFRVFLNAKVGQQAVVDVSKQLKVCHSPEAGF